MCNYVLILYFFEYKCLKKRVYADDIMSPRFFDNSVTTVSMPSIISPRIVGQNKNVVLPNGYVDDYLKELDFKYSFRGVFSDNLPDITTNKNFLDSLVADMTPNEDARGIAKSILKKSADYECWQAYKIKPQEIVPGVKDPVLCIDSLGTLETWESCWDLYKKFKAISLLNLKGKGLVLFSHLGSDIYVLPTEVFASYCQNKRA